MSQELSSKPFDSTDLVLRKERRSQTWQAWSKEGRRKWVNRFIKEKEESGDDTSVIKHPVKVNSMLDSDEEELHALETSAADEEELDVIVSSWRRNFTYFQQEQARRAALAARAAEDDEEDNILGSILEEETRYGEEYEDDEDETNLDDATIYTLATHEEAEFREFVRRHEQRQQPKPFMERFLEALGILDEEGDDDTFLSGNASVYTTRETPTLHHQDGNRTPPVQKNITSNNSVARGGDGQREAATSELSHDTPAIPSFDSEDIELQHSHEGPKADGYKKREEDDVLLGFPAISHPMTM
jgi:hypothetical protein